MVGAGLHTRNSKGGGWRIGIRRIGVLYMFRGGCVYGEWCGAAVRRNTAPNCLSLGNQ